MSVDCYQMPRTPNFDRCAAALPKTNNRHADRSEDVRRKPAGRDYKRFIKCSEVSTIELQAGCWLRHLCAHGPLWSPRCMIRKSQRLGLDRGPCSIKNLARDHDATEYARSRPFDGARAFIPGNHHA